MSGSYRAAMARIADQLAIACPARLVTRSYLEFGDRKATDLQRGVYCVLSSGVASYDYEASDHWGALDGPLQTELGTFEFTVVGQMKLPDKSLGEAIEDAEFAMLAELEAFADRGIADDTLKDLRLMRSTLSQQLEAPFAWVHTSWRLRLFD